MSKLKIDPITVWNIPKDGSIKDFPAADFLKSYRFAKWYLSFSDPDNDFFKQLIKAVDLSILSLRMSPNNKLVLVSEILQREFCQEDVKPASENILELQISRNTYFRHLNNGIKIVTEFVQDYLDSLD